MTRILALIAGAAATASVAHAGFLDLTSSGTSQMINGAVFETADVHASGTGAIDPFVRLQSNTFEQGYNTSSNHPAFDEKTGSWTHDLLLSDVGTRTVDGNVYYEFLLDINQINGGDNHFISLEQVQIYTSPLASQNTTNVASLGTLRYDMDADGDSWVKLDANLSTGSGGADMRLLVPMSTFAADPQSSFVYLYSSFGTHNPSNDGFEEWAIQGSPAPAPGPIALLGIGGVLVLRRRR